MKVAITGGAGQINYNLLFRIASGEMFGPDRQVTLKILEIPEAMQALEGVKMELNDCANPLLKEVILTDQAEVAFDDIDLAILVGAKPRGKGMERKDLLLDNGKHFVSQGKALNKVAKKSARIFVVGNPCNSNCLVTMHHAPNLDPKNFYAMTRLDYNRAIYQVAQKAGCSLADVSDMTIWGNHSATQVPDICNTKVKGLPIRDAIPDHAWLQTTFVQTVQKRGAAIIEARGKSSAASAANAILDSIRSIHSNQEHYTNGVYSKGNPYGIDENLIFSFPLLSNGDDTYTIRDQFVLDEWMMEKVKESEKELIEERDMIANLL